MARLTEEKIALIQEAYGRIGTYSGVAKEIGCSPATVKKYVAAAPVRQKPKKEPQQCNQPVLSIEEITFLKDYLGELCYLSEDERKDTENLWEEM